MTAVLVLGLGLVGLTVAGNLVVRGASHIGLRFGLSPLVVGLTIVAAGTSAPELAVSLGAVRAGDPDLAVGNVVGSNIANVLLVLGLTAVIGTVHVTARVVRVDVPIMIGASLAFLLLALDGALGRPDGLLLVTGLVVFVTWTLRAARNGTSAGAPGDVETEAVPRDPGLGGSVASLAVGIGLLVLTARLVVDGAEDLARSLGVPDLVVGLTVVALGTSAPEVATSLVAAARGQRDLAVGNAVGSNIFNILLVIGVTAAVSSVPVEVADDVLALDLPIMIVAAVACLPLLAQGHRLERWEGIAFVGYYLAYLVFVGLDATDHGARDPFAVVMTVFVAPLTVLIACTVAVRGRRRSTRPSAPPPATGSSSLAEAEHP